LAAPLHPPTDVVTHTDPPPEPPEPYPVFVGKYDYDSRTDDDLAFKKGDLMYILNTDEQDWWFARSKDSGKQGYIPSNYVSSAAKYWGEDVSPVYGSGPHSGGLCSCPVAAKVCEAGGSGGGD